MKKGLFTGWTDVLSFTFVQNTKTKAFKTTLIGIGVLVFIIFFMINMVTGYVKNEKKDKNNINSNEIEKLYVINGTDILDDEFIDFSIEYNDYAETNIQVVKDVEPSEIINEMNDNEINGVVINLYIGDDNKEGKTQFMLDVYSAKSLEEKNVTKLAENFEEYLNRIKYSITSVDMNTMKVVLSETNVYSVNVDEADESFGEMLAKIFVPMIFVLIIYMMILMYGQSISKSLVVEKNSKLMEMLLISVKPYAIVFGKIMAMYFIAVLQMTVWTIGGVAGFVVSDKLAKETFEKYKNPIIDVINIMKNDSSSAFSVKAIIIGIAAFLIGFLLYCVFAGLIASNITKAEELANGMAIYQMVVVVGFLGAYMLPLMQGNGLIVKVIRYIPITSAFMLTSDIIVGNIGIVGALCSMGIMFVTIFVMVIVTGKIYKKKVF